MGTPFNYEGGGVLEYFSNKYFQTEFLWNKQLSEGHDVNLWLTLQINNKPNQKNNFIDNFFF